VDQGNEGVAVVDGDGDRAGFFLRVHIVCEDVNASALLHPSYTVVDDQEDSA
jgi:hypothetical protein